MGGAVCSTTNGCGLSTNVMKVVNPIILLLYISLSYFWSHEEGIA